MIYVLITFAFFTPIPITAQENTEKNYEIDWAMLFSGLTSLGVIFSIAILVFEYRKKSKVDSANITTTLILEFDRNHSNTITKIAHHINNNPQKFDQFEISYLLDSLDTFSFYVRDGVITKRTAYEHFVSLMDRIFKIDYIVDFINDTEKIAPIAWSNVKWLKNEFEKIKSHEH